MDVNGRRKTCSHAAVSRHIEIVKWARENGCSWDHKTCINFASRKIWMDWCGQERMAVLGIATPVRWRRNIDTLGYWSGQERMAVLGTTKLVLALQNRSPQRIVICLLSAFLSIENQNLQQGTNENSWSWRHGCKSRMLNGMASLSMHFLE